MARKVKKNLDYFSLDITFSDSVRLAVKEMGGGNGICLLIELWQKIYGTNGYYMKFDKDNKILFLDYSIVKMDLDELDKCMQIFFNRNIFDKKIYDKYHILTSDSIQERYIEICISTKRASIELIKEYLCINELDFDLSKFILKSATVIDDKNIQLIHKEVQCECNNFGINDSNSVINSEKSTQSKVKQIKEEESKAKQSKEESEYLLSDIQIECKEQLESYEKTFLIEDLQNFIAHFKSVSIEEQEIKNAMHDFKMNKISSTNPKAPYVYTYYKEWLKKYIQDNREKYKHIPKFRVTYIDEKVERLDLHAAFDFYWQPEYTIEFIRDKIYSGEFKPKNNLNFKKLIDDNLITTEND